MSAGTKIDKFILQKARFKALAASINQDMQGSGIYCILNKINGHKYIGQSKSISHIRQHTYALDKGIHGNPYLQNAWSCYGSATFTFVVIEYCDIEKLDEREQYWIDELDPVYNIAKDVIAWREYFADRDAMPDGCYIKQGETFIRPEWHLWVYGGQKSMK
jgi:hypothetical protein